jgi:hypothetical protein
MIIDSKLCNCFTPGYWPLHRPWCSVFDLVPGYSGSPDGAADAADQARQDGAA